MTTHPTFTSLQKKAFLAIFYRSGNASPDAEISESRNWWERLDPHSDTRALPTLLPRRRDGNLDEWYAIAWSESQSRRMAEEVAAFTGLTYSDFSGRRAPLDDAPVDLAVQEFTDGHGFKFRAKADGREALDRLLRVWTTRPASRSADEIRSVGRLRRDFEAAVTVGDRGLAEELLRTLDEGAHLTRENLLFLKVRMLDGLGLWTDLLELEDLPDLLGKRKPVAVTDALLRAVYRVHLAPVESNPSDALTHFRNDVYPQFGALLGLRSGLRSPEAIKSFMLLAVGGEPPDFELRDELLNAGLSGPDGAVLAAFGALLPGTETLGLHGPPVDPQALIASLRERGDYDRLLLTVYEQKPSAERARLLLECADRLSTLLSQNAVQAAMASLTEVDLEIVLSEQSAQAAWARLKPLKDELMPSSWAEWCHTVAAIPDWPDAQSVVHRGVTEWDRPWEFDGSRAGELVDGLVGVYVSAPALLSAALPYIAGMLFDDEAWPRPSLRPVYDACLDALHSAERISDPDLEIFGEFLAGLLSLGPTLEEYVKYTDWTAELFRNRGSVARIDRMLDQLDVLAVQPCPSAARRVDVAAAADAVLTKFQRRLRPEQVRLFRLICSDLDYESSITETSVSEADESWPLSLDALVGKVVAIYTLTESAGRQAKKRLEQLFKGVDVRLCHDKAGSDRLKELAQTAELFVVATRSAKHAATEEIKRWRQQRPVVYPAGKGMASIVAGVADFARDAQVS